MSKPLEEQFIQATSNLIDSITEDDVELMQLTANALETWKSGYKPARDAAVDAIFARKIELINQFIEGRKKCSN